MTDSGNSAHVPGTEKKAVEEAGVDFFAMLGLVIANTIFVLAMSDWLQSFFTGLPAAMLDNSLVAVALTFIAITNSAPKGWAGLLRLAGGTALFSLAVLSSVLLSGLVMHQLLPTNFKEAHLDELKWFGLVPVLLLSFPLGPALARIGLMPGFRWTEEGPLRGVGADEEGEAAAHPDWFPPGAGRRLPAILAAGGLGLGSYRLFEWQALTRPDSFFHLVEPELAAFAVFGGGMLGLFWWHNRGWLTLLAATLAGSAAMTSVMLAFGFALFLLWPEISPPISGLLSIVPLLLVFLFTADRVFRRDSENTSRTTNRGEP